MMFTHLLHYLSLLAILLEVVLSATVYFKHRKEQGKSMSEHSKCLLFFMGISTLLMVYSTIYYWSGKVEVLNEYAMSIAYLYILVFSMFTNAGLGYKWYRVGYVWLIFGLPAVMAVCFRAYMENYQDFRVYYYEWADLIDSFSMKNIVLVGRFFIFFILLGYLIVTKTVYHNYRLFLGELEKQGVNKPMWLRDFFLPSMGIGFLFFLDSVLALRIYHLTFILVLIAVSCYHYYMYWKAKIQMEYQEKTSFTDHKVKEDFIQIKRISSDIEEWLGQQPFPLANDKLTLLKMAKQLNIKTSNLEYYLEHEVGLPFTNWVNQQKLEYCCRLLKSTRLPLGHISSLAGYHDLSAMSKAFKRRYGITPSAYRSENAIRE